MLEYDGGRFAGFQAQGPAAGPTVQGTLEEALRCLTGGYVRVYPSGRTDAGVHALGQVVHFDLDSPVPTDRLPAALNALLPPDVSVVEAAAASRSFHARKDAVRKAYEYLILNAPRRSPLWRRGALWVRAPLDFELMQQAAASFVGRHDFSAFTSSDRSVQTTVRTVFQSEVVDASRRLAGRKGATLLSFTVEGDGFLMHMVRVMAGTLIDIGRGKLAPDAVRTALASGRRADAGPTAAPHGLYLTRVRY